MPPLGHDEITALSREVIQDHPCPLELIGVAYEGGSNRVEIMMGRLRQGEL